MYRKATITLLALLIALVSPLAAVSTEVPQDGDYNSSKSLQQVNIDSFSQPASADDNNQARNEEEEKAEELPPEKETAEITGEPRSDAAVTNPPHASLNNNPKNNSDANASTGSASSDDAVLTDGEGYLTGGAPASLSDNEKSPSEISKEQKHLKHSENSGGDTNFTHKAKEDPLLGYPQNLKVSGHNGLTSAASDQTSPSPPKISNVYTSSDIQPNKSSKAVAIGNQPKSLLYKLLSAGFIVSLLLIFLEPYYHQTSTPLLRVILDKLNS